MGLYYATLIAHHTSGTGAQVRAVVRHWTFTAHPKPAFEIDGERWMGWQKAKTERQKTAHVMTLGKEYTYEHVIPGIWKKLYEHARDAARAPARPAPFPLYARHLSAHAGSRVYVRVVCLDPFRVHMRHDHDACPQR